MRRVFCTLKIVRLTVVALTIVVVGGAPRAHASATLLLEEPYGHMRIFTGTGHAAIYFSSICAQSPVVLRACAPGEPGIVLSRYDGVGAYDWLAMPLIPYLYAVERAEDVPLFADTKMVAYLRDHYRRNYLENIIPDGLNGETPGGNWYQLIGTSYDRTVYGFEFETTPEQDAALIQKLNSSPNRSHFHLASNNCADFAKEIINFYYPKTLHRSVIADVGITTPKQIAKMLVKFEARHPELETSRMVIAQVPGSMPRSSAPRGVVESFLKSGHYIVPSAIVSPIFAGCVFAVYFASGGAAVFRPDRNAMVLSPGGELETPISKEDRKAYERQLKHLLAEASPVASPESADKAWTKVESKAKTEYDDRGGLILKLQVEQHLVRLGASAGNVLDSSAPPEMVERILAARLEAELKHGPARGVSENVVARDWSLLQQTMRRETERESRAALSASSAPVGDSATANGP
jgi:hypothetical protein